MYQTDEPVFDAEGRDWDLLLRAGKLVKFSGLSGLTLRSVAEAAGISPSLLTYRFGSREALILQMFEAARLQDCAFWEDCETQLGKLVIGKSDVAGVMNGLAAHAMDTAATNQVLRWICATQAMRSDSLMETAQLWSGNGLGASRLLLESSGTDVSLAPSLHAAMVWIVRTGLSARQDGMLAYAWTSDLILRLAGRLFMPEAVSAGDSRARQEIERRARRLTRRAEDSKTGTPELIVETAAHLLTELGPDGLTHRAIAKAAKLSLSSLTHHFSSLSEIEAHAFARLYDELRRRSVPAMPQAMSINTFLDVYLPQIFARADENGGQGAAMDEIILAASRQDDSQALSGGMMALVGQSSTLMLSAMSEARAIDRLDGQIFRFVLTGLREQAAHQAKGEREEWFREHCAVFLRHYLGSG